MQVRLRHAHQDLHVLLWDPTCPWGAWTEEVNGHHASSIRGGSSRPPTVPRSAAANQLNQDAPMAQRWTRRCAGMAVHVPDEQRRLSDYFRSVCGRLVNGPQRAQPSPDQTRRQPAREGHGRITTSRHHLDSDAITGGVMALWIATH